MQNPMSAQSRESNSERKPVTRRRCGGHAKDLDGERSRFDRQRRLAERRLDDDFDTDEDDDYVDLDKDFDEDMLDELENLDDSEDLDDDDFEYRYRGDDEE